MASLYADENVPLPLVGALRALGHDVLTALDDGRANQGIGDQEVLDRATALGRAVLTNNRKDFHRLHRHRPNHAGSSPSRTTIFSRWPSGSTPPSPRSLRSPGGW